MRVKFVKVAVEFTYLAMGTFKWYSRFQWEGGNEDGSVEEGGEPRGLSVRRGYRWKKNGIFVARLSARRSKFARIFSLARGKPSLNPLT